ncbi:Cysteine-rich hydrophobic domain-containing protein 2 [Halotydeus destructor]|nr:Cysteine-rich hydrophobic domain-containing protein 2 [Halotydeus destructor]
MASSIVAPSISSNSSLDSIAIVLPPPPPLPLVTAPSRRTQQFDIIEELDSSNGSNPSPVDRSTPEVANYPSNEPIIVRGNGNMTLFGLSNTFNSDFPSTLLGRVSREEFDASLARVNNLLRAHHSTNAKLLLLGCLCCCCSFGCSLLWPTLALSKRTRTALEKLLASENSKLYHKLGLNWKLSKERCHSNHAFMEYVLVIDFLPKLHLHQPD